jgi:hypothetical protein
MTSDAKNVEEYLKALEPERKAIVEKIHNTLLSNLPKGVESGMQYGMLGYFIPHSVFTPGYHCDPKEPLPFMGLASQKNSVNLYHMALYVMPDKLAWFKAEYAKTGLKLDMGKSCIRFKKLDQIPYELIAKLASCITAEEYIKLYTETIDTRTRKP